MKKKLKDIAEFILLFWCCGGGGVIGLVYFAFAWKLGVVILGLWGCSVIMAILILINKQTSKKRDKK